MQQHLKLEALRALILYPQHRLYPILAQRHAVDQIEVVRPRALGIIAKLLRRQAEVHRDAVVAAGG